LAGVHVKVVIVGGDGRLGETHGRCSVGRAGSGLNTLHQPRHPEVTHGVLELLAVHVTFELLGVLLDPGSPIVLDLVVGSSRQMLCNFGPPVSPARMKVKNQKLFF